MSIKNQLSVVYISILIAFYLTPTKLARFTLKLSYEIVNIIILVKIYFPICSRDISENFIDRCFKLFLNIICIPKVKLPRIEKKCLGSVLPYFGTISQQTRAKWKKSIKVVLNCCKLQVFLKIQSKLCNNFRFKDLVPDILTSGIV